MEKTVMSRARPRTKKRLSWWEVLGQIALLIVFLLLLALFVLGRMRGSIPHHTRFPH
jgi:4-hydroxybenzoate polyprenyltransferase